MNTKNPLRSPVSRRWFLGTVPVAVAAVATACGSSASTSSGSSSTASAASTAVATGSAAAGSVAALAQAFYQSLSDEQKTTVLQDYSLANAERWSNLPQGLLGGGTGGGGGQSGMPSGSAPGGGGSGAPSGSAPGGSGSQSGGAGGGGSNGTRLGVSLGDLNDAQLAAFTALLKAATGTTAGLGYDEITQHLNADDYLADNGGGDDYGRANFYVAILGSPQDSGTWELQFGGHHLAVANTYTDGSLVGATPSFRGIEPNAAFELDGTTNQPLKVKEAAFTALLAGLSADQLATAKLDDTFSDLVLGAGQDWAFPDTKEGLEVASLSGAQKELVTAAIATYVDDLAEADAKTVMATYTDGLDETYVAYSGTTALTERNDYVRIDGPRVWIEFSMQNGIVLSGNHPHSVWRDRQSDYGGTKS